ncbi:hypothetical protein AAG906_012012 [Vitis piasezkii]
MGLNTDLYAQLRTNILSQDPLPSLDRAYQPVIQDEHKPTEVLGFAVRQSLEEDEENGEAVCSHRKKTGMRLQLVGPSLLVLTTGRGRGSACANAASSIVGASSTKSSHRSTLHTEQWKALAGLIGNAQVRDGRLNALFECPVGLPNGESVVATQSGSTTPGADWNGVRRDGLYYLWSEGDSIQHVSHNATSTLSCGTKGWDILRESSELVKYVFVLNILETNFL